MRRKEKEIAEKKVLDEIIDEAMVCRLGLYDGTRPYIVPMSFGYREGNLYFHSAPEGRKIDILKKHPEVFFEIDIPGSTVESVEACGWSMNYRSVMGEGTAEFMHTVSEQKEALNIIMEHYSGRKDWDFPERMLEKTLVFTVKIETATAKKSGA